MTYTVHPVFRALYAAYTGDPDGIGPHLNSHMGSLSRDDALLVATGSDIVIFPGGDRPPSSESFRLSTRGFVELTSVSHLGVAVPYLVQQRDLGDDRWRADAENLMARAAAIRAVNSPAFWHDDVAVEAWAGRETAIANMVDYACEATGYMVARLFADPTIDHAYLRAHFLDTSTPDDILVPMNDMMAATFALVALDNSFRIIRWLKRQDFDWSRLMVLISGRAGRPTAGVTWATNSLCHLLWQASGATLDHERLYIAPHAPGLVLDDLASIARAREVEASFRGIWFSSRATVEMGRLMYRDYPAFERSRDGAPVVDAATQSLAALPVVRSAVDRRAIVTRLRFVMEDPAQQLVNAGMQFIVDQLCSNDNCATEVEVPGLDGANYPMVYGAE